MAFKPNYRAERMDRERSKAAKKEARLKAAEERSAQRKAEQATYVDTAADPNPDRSA